MTHWFSTAKAEWVNLKSKGKTQLLQNSRARTTETHPQIRNFHLISHSAIGQVQAVPSVVFLLWVLRPNRPNQAAGVGMKGTVPSCCDAWCLTWSQPCVTIAPFGSWAVLRTGCKSLVFDPLFNYVLHAADKLAAGRNIGL